MNRMQLFEDELSDWLEDGPVYAPDRVLNTVLAAFPSISQRRVGRHVSWRLPPMNRYARALAVIAAAAVISVGGLVFLNKSPAATVGAPPSPSSSPSVAASRPAGSASPAASVIDTSGWRTFTSSRHGVTLRYPAGWTATAATAPWPIGAALTAQMSDILGVPKNSFDTFTVVSQPLPTGVSGDAWLTTYEERNARMWPKECWPAPAGMERTTVDGQPAWIHGGCGFLEAVTFVGGRVYLLNSAADFDRPMFDAFLSTVTFDPAKANDAPAARTSSSAGPSGS